VTTKNEEVEEENPEEEGTAFEAEDPDHPLIGLCGDVTEAAAQSLSVSLLLFNGGKLRATPDDLEDTSDIEFVINSGGGSVNDMFAIYDLMEVVKKNRDIATFGFGKIYSAAVPLLTAGTKGKRYIAKNARLMLHYCSVAAAGTAPSIRTSFEELKKLEEMMLAVLAENSHLSMGEIYNILSKNTDEYFSAEDALEMGLIDKII